MRNSRVSSAVLRPLRKSFLWRCEPDALRQIWNHLLKDFASTADELRNITVEENKCRWEAYGPGGSVGHGLAEEAAKECYVHTRVSGDLKDCDAPKYVECQKRKKRTRPQ